MSEIQSKTAGILNQFCMDAIYNCFSFLRSKPQEQIDENQETNVNSKQSMKGNSNSNYKYDNVNTMYSLEEQELHSNSDDEETNDFDGWPGGQQLNLDKVDNSQNYQTAITIEKSLNKKSMNQLSTTEEENIKSKKQIEIEAMDSNEIFGEVQVPKKGINFKSVIKQNNETNHNKNVQLKSVQKMNFDQAYDQNSEDHWVEEDDVKL